ncbi:MAG: hypothetical protein HYZ28_10195 [Myxococcales bacterium]|nr:hypothetical protein [Myxococcales bacterium]
MRRAALALWLAALGCQSTTKDPELTRRVEPASFQPNPGAEPLASPAPAALVAVEEPDPDGDEGGEGQPVGIHLGSCDGPGCELVIHFSQAMAKRPKVQLEPPLKGSFHWRSPRELVFTPRKKLGWGHQVQVSVSDAVPLTGPAQAQERPFIDNFSVPYLQVAGKVADWPVVEGRPRLVTILNQMTDRIGRGPALLLYDQPVDPRTISKEIYATDDRGQALRLKIRRPKSAAPMYDGEIDLSLLVAVSLPDLPAHGERVTLSFPTWQQGDRGEAEAATESRILTVSSSFALVGKESDGGGFERLPLEGRILLRFNNSIDARTREAVSMRPEPESMNAEVWGDTLSIQLKLSPGAPHRLRVRGLRDIFGNELDEKVDLELRAQDLSAVLETSRLPLLLERGEVRLPVRTQNTGPVAVQLWRFDSPQSFLEAHEAMKRPASCSTLGALAKLGAATARPKSRLNASPEVLDVKLGVRPGFYCVDVSAAGRGSESEGTPLTGAVLAQVSNLGTTAKVFSGGILAWVTRLDEASAVPRAKVTLMDGEGKVLSRGVSGEDGVALLRADEVASGAGLSKRVFVLAQTKEDATLTQLDDERLSQPWQFGLQGEVVGGGPLYASLFTDRGVYRPEETVHIKAIVAGAGSLSSSERKAQLRVQDPRGQQVIDQAVPLDAFGAADLDLKLKLQAPVGSYSVRLSRGDRSTTRRFQVEEYRVPTFEVKVSTPDSSWSREAELSATVEARYLHGGALSGREVRYSVLRDREVFAPAGFPGYVFSLEAPAPVGAVEEAEKRLDGDGRLALRFRADHPSSAGPMRYVVEASVTDVDRQVYAGRLSSVVHPAAFYVGVRPPARRVVHESSAIEVPLVAVKPSGEPAAGVDIRAAIERVDYHTTARLAGASAVELHNRPVEERAGECAVKSGEGDATCRFRVSDAGEYLVRAWATDAGGRTVQTGFRVAVSGNDRAAWPRFDQDRVEVVADKPSYRPGDTARLVVQTPFPKARGLLTLENGAILTRRMFEIDGDTPALEVPIDASHAPNVFASVVLLRGRAHGEKDATGFETGAPAFKLGYANLKVEPSSQRLSIEVQPERSVSAPGKPLQLQVSVRDAAGNPSAGQATVMVVDEAVLGLTAHRTPDPIFELYSARPLGVRTGESRLELPNARRARREQLFPGGDGGEGFGLKILPADLRNLFKSTAYWNPKLEVPASGVARVTVELPDNLTTFRVMAVVVDQGGRAGSGEKKVTVRKPLMVQPVLPRFAYPGDELRLEALVFNGTERTGKVELSAKLAGLDAAGEPLALSGVVKPGESARFSFPVKVVARSEAVVRFAASLLGENDAVEVKLPVLNPGSKRVQVASAQVSGERELSLSLPADRQVGTEQLEVMVSTTSLSELKDSVDYLMGYPNGCIEQTTSRAYPLVVLRDLLPDMGVTVSEADLQKFSEAGIKRLLSFQTPAGGLAYWPGSDKPHAFGTAFGLTALIEGKKRGFDVPDDALRRMGDYLESQLRQGTISEEMPHGGMADADTRALFVVTLGRLGRPQPSYLSSLWRERQKLTPFGLSMLAVAVSESEDSSLLQPVLAEVRKAAQESPQEAWFEGDRAAGWSMGSPLRTHGMALLAFSGDTRSDASAKLLSGLLKRRVGGLWGNTQENVFGIMGVAKLAGSAGAPGPAPKLQLAVDGREITDGAMEAVSPRVRRYLAPSDALALARGREAAPKVQLRNRGVPVYLTVRAQYDVTLEGKNREARASGFTVTRRYETLEGVALDGRAIPLGSVVRVRLGVKSEEKRNYVAIDDKLPAGLEPMNTALATTERVSQGKMTPERERGLASLSYSETRDSRVAFYADELPAGSYEYVYLARATTPGRFLRPAASAEAMYAPEISGATAIDEVEVR